MKTDGLNELTRRIIGAVFSVHSALGSGFLEKVYENALALELKLAGMKFETQCPVKVAYRGETVGDFVADVLVEDTVLVELKAVKALSEAHSAQCVNYIKATGLPVCLLVNFGEEKAKVRRFINPALRLSLD